MIARGGVGAHCRGEGVAASCRQAEAAIPATDSKEPRSTRKGRWVRRILVGEKKGMLVGWKGVVL